jgi:hypothetical protein
MGDLRTVQTLDHEDYSPLGNVGHSANIIQRYIPEDTSLYIIICFWNWIHSCVHRALVQQKSTTQRVRENELYLGSTLAFIFK